MTMTVSDLIAALEQFDGDTEVRMAHQPSWPFEYSIDQVVEAKPKFMTHSEFAALPEAEQERLMVDGDDELELVEDDEPQPQAVVYLGEGRQLGYLPSAATKELGWGRG